MFALRNHFIGYTHYYPQGKGRLKPYLLFSDDLLAQTLRTSCVRSVHILLVEFKFHMGYGLPVTQAALVILIHRLFLNTYAPRL